MQIPEELETLLNKQLQLTFEGYFINHLKIDDLNDKVRQMLEIIKGNFGNYNSVVLKINMMKLNQK